MASPRCHCDRGPRDAAARLCPYVEGWWVDPDLRKQGIGRALFAAIESWCREHGFTELASDARVDNLDSQAAHAALGFEPTERLQFLRKPLG